MIAAWRSARELRALVEELAPVDWRDPAWWAVIGGAAAIEGLAPRRLHGDHAYVVSGGEPAADTFIGWPAPGAPDLAGAIADAIALAHAARAALAALDGTLPGQPLARVLRDRKDGARPVPADLADVVFAVGDVRLLATLSAAAADDVAVAEALARAVVARAPGQADAVAARAPTAAIAVVIGDHAPATARHLHRRAWTDAGGPWLGVGRAGPLAIASTCHMVVDGYGHALIAARIAAATAARDDAHRRLARTAAAIVGDAAPIPALPPLAGAAPLGVAWRALPAPVPRLPALAHALGRVLHADAGDPAASMSPVFQVPVAPGAKDDPLRWRRRVVHALLSVRFTDGVPEPLDVFATRARAAIAREAAGDGLASRLLAATAAAPVPLGLKRRRMVGARAPWLRGPIEALAGRCALSVMRLQPADVPGAPPPMIAVSAPGQALAPDDPRATSVITVIAGPGGDAIATLAGSGAAATPAGAAALLDRWLAAVG